MTQEEIDFIHFRDVQLLHIDYSTGQVDITKGTKDPKVRMPVYDVGSINQDGYSRIWCNGKLRMKHRLVYWLYHNELPVEVDHHNSRRDHNNISNLQPSHRAHNTVAKEPRSYKQLTKQEVMALCEDIQQGDLNITELALKHGRSRCQIKGIMVKKYWKAIADEYF